jgi:hypothetical protein
MLSVGYAADDLTTYLGFFKLPVPGTTGNLNWSVMSAMEKMATLFVADKDDWLLPNYGELDTMLRLGLQDNSKLQLSINSNGVRYWSSSSTSNQGWRPIATAAFPNIGGVESYEQLQTLQFSLRPIRYFG